MTHSEKNTYMAVTIGPLYRTLEQARKIRELWGASFLFSQLMQAIVINIDAQSTIFERLLPRYDANAVKQQGVGLFPDRLFLRIKKHSEGNAEIESILNRCLQIAVDSIIYDPVESDVINCYIQTYGVQTQLSTDENYIEKLNLLLDGAELAQKAGNAMDFILAKYLKTALPNFYTYAFKDKRKQFETLAEIGANDLLKMAIDVDEFIENYREDIGTKDEIDFYVNLIKHLQEKGQQEIIQRMRQYHKYIAIIHADGDNLGQIIRKIGNQDINLGQFSQTLFNFAADATKLIDSWGGMPIYAGGDDLLFVAPVCTEGKTIFALLDEIQGAFSLAMRKLELSPDITTPTISFGMNIIYYKFPLSEGLVESRNLLFEKAKKVSGKNSIAFRIQKHSGSDFEAILPNQLNTADSHWRQLLLAAIQKDSDAFFRSTMYTLSQFENLLKPIISDKERMGCFFDNHFNEAIHKSIEGEKQRQAVKELLYEFVDKFPDTDVLKNAFALLRFIQFIQTDFQS